MKAKNADTPEGLAALIAEGFERMEDRFEQVEQKIDDFEKKFDQEARDLREGLRRVEHEAGEIKEDLRAVTKAVDKDAVTIVRHEHRIKQLERA